MFQLRRLHFLVGVTGLIAFLLTGQYMYWVLGGLKTMPDGPRMFIRSVHIYLLWASLLNLALGAYSSRLTQRPERQLQFASSLFVLAGPFLLCYSFFFEPHTEELLRPAGRLAILLSAAGAVVQVATVVYCNAVARNGNETR